MSFGIRLVEFEEINSEFLKKWEQLATASGSGLPFHQPILPLTWWKQFHGQDGVDFPVKRGKNYFGTNSRVNKFQVLVAEKENIFFGLIPLVSVLAKVSGIKGEIRILTFCGDTVLAAYHDFLVHPDFETEIVPQLFGKLLLLVQEDHDFLFLGYFPERSRNLPLLQKAMATAVEQGWTGGLGLNQRKGGVHPWSIGILESGLKKLSDKFTDEILKQTTMQLATKLAETNPASLFFAGTRIALENSLKLVLEQLKLSSPTNEILEAITELEEQLVPAPIDYPRLTLAKNRESYFAGFSKDTRRYFNRYKRRFEEAGGTFEKVLPAQITESDIEDYLGLHKQKWGDDSVAVNEGTVAFHKESAMQLAKQGLFTLFFARFEGRRIASHSCIDIAKRREGYYNGRDPALEELRAGRLLYMETILDAIDLGLEEYDLGYGGANYKAAFTNTFGRTKNLFAFRSEKSIAIEKIFTGYEFVSVTS